MNEDILGVIDALESIILEGKKVPFSNKVILDEERLLMLLDKLRRLVKNQESTMARDIVEQKKGSQSKAVEEASLDMQKGATKESPTPEKMIVDAQKKSVLIKNGADEYADNVLAKLQLLVTRLQKNLIKLEKNIDEGRGVLEAPHLAEKEDSLKEIINETQ